MDNQDSQDIRLTIGDLTIAVKGRTWAQTPGHGVARIIDGLIRFTCPEREEEGSYPHYLEGTIHPDDVAKLPPGFIASLTFRCICGNAISAEDEGYCNYCREHLPEPPEDVYREPIGVILAEQAQRGNDPIWNEGDF